jgi:hypothetical protein
VSRLSCVIVVALLAASACRPDPVGPSPYQNQEAFPDGGAGDGADSTSLPGPDPFMPGTKRLSVGIFYEGGKTDEVPIDNMTTHLYVYSGTVLLQPSADHIEGKSADQIVSTGMPWWGLGVNWDAAHDLSAWKTMHVSFQATDASFAGFTIGMLAANSANAVFVNATPYGFTSDGNWHTLAIPLADLTVQGLDLKQCTAAFVLGGTNAPGGANLRIDDLYFSQ